MVRVGAEGSKDASGVPMAEGVTYSFTTGAVRIDTPEPGVVPGSTLMVSGVVAASETSPVLVRFLDGAGDVISSSEALRTPTTRQEGGTSIDEWEITVPVPMGADSVQAKAGSSIDEVAVLVSALASVPSTPVIAEEDIESGTGTETDPYVVIRDNPLVLGEASLGDIGQTYPARSLYVSDGSAGCPAAGELSWLEFDDTLTEPFYSCMSYAGAGIGWAGLSPRLLVTEVGSGAPAAGYNTPVPDVAATSGMVTWHDRGGLSLQSGKTYRVDYEIQRFDELDSLLDQPIATTQAKAPLYVRLADDVRVVPVFSITWVRGSSAVPDDDPLWDDLYKWAPRQRAMDSLFDYRNGYYQPEVNEAGREVLKVGREQPQKERYEYPVDAIAQQCYEYDTCKVQFQQFRPPAFAVSTASGNDICDSSNTYFNFGIRPTDVAGDADWTIEADIFYNRQVWELMPPDEARFAREMWPLIHNYGEIVRSKSGHELGDCLDGFNGIRYRPLPLVSVEARDYYGPVTAHEFVHAMLDEFHCGESDYVDPDSLGLSSSECQAEQILMTANAPTDCTVLTESQCERLCAAAEGSAQNYIEYAENNLIQSFGAVSRLVRIHSRS